VTDSEIDEALAEHRVANGCHAAPPGRRFGYCCSYHDGFLDGMLHAQEHDEHPPMTDLPDLAEYQP
jgi:hypothetical protein